MVSGGLITLVPQLRQATVRHCRDASCRSEYRSEIITPPTEESDSMEVLGK